MNIFTYNSLKTKACRDIERLIKSEIALDVESSIDHALNAAFTIHHLVEWLPNQTKISANEFSKKSENYAIKLLRKIVTNQKHNVLTSRIYEGDVTPMSEDFITDICFEEGECMLTEDNKNMITENSRIKVYFGEHEGETVLRDALSEFD